MKIAIDIRALEGPRYGGVAEYIYHLLPALFEAAPQHSFLLFTNARRSIFDPKLFENFSNVSFHRFRYPNKIFIVLCRYGRVLKLDRLLGGADVYFNPHFLPAPVSATCKKVTTFHDLSFEYFPEFFDWRRRLWHAVLFPKHEADVSNALIAVSHSTRRDLENVYGIEPNKITVVYSGLPTETNKRIHDDWSMVRKKFRLPEHYILSLSTIEPRKNLTCLLRAFELIKAEHIFDGALVCAGTYGWSYKKILRDARTSPNAHDIIFTGSVSHEEKLSLLKHATIFAYPSLYEGFGFPPLEAMAHGIPTVTSFFASLPEVVGDAALLVDPTRPRVVADALIEILKDPRLANELSRRGPIRAHTFRWQNAAQKTLAVLESV